jgi:hypothetical protein
MPLYIIERNFAEKLDINAEGVAAVSKINGEVGVNWLFSFLSGDKKKTYCLYEAPSAEAIVEAARLAGIPADVVTQVSESVGADPRLGGLGSCSGARGRKTAKAPCLASLPRRLGLSMPS